jgi:hypothetical protein
MHPSGNGNWQRLSARGPASRLQLEIGPILVLAAEAGYLLSLLLARGSAPTTALRGRSILTTFQLDRPNACSAARWAGGYTRQTRDVQALVAPLRLQYGRGVPVRLSHIRTVPSALLLATNWPSAPRATLSIVPVCPSSAATGRRYRSPRVAPCHPRRRLPEVGRQQKALDPRLHQRRLAWSLLAALCTFPRPGRCHPRPR